MEGSLHEDDLVLIDFASDFHEEVPEVCRGGGEDHLVGGERGAPAARKRHVGEVLAGEDVSRQPAELVAVIAPLQPQLGFVHSGHHQNFRTRRIFSVSFNTPPPNLSCGKTAWHW